MKERIASLLTVCFVTATVFSGCKNGSLPTITTNPVTNITMSSATSGGSITDDGGSEIITRGVCWSTEKEPTTNDQKTSDGTGSGDFISTITALSESTTYYVRAYAVNTEGTAYGQLQTFNTTAAGMSAVVTSPVTSLTSTSVVAGGNVTNDGGRNVSERGIVWSNTPAPTINNHRIPAGSGTGVFTTTISGLTDGTVYYIRSYATSILGTSYGNEIVFITPVTDIEGNVYKTTKIGNQVWMAENLRTTHYNDNSLIPQVKDSVQWAALTTPAYAWYRNNAANKPTNGALYTWYTVATGKLCPAGWHAPSNTEFETLELTVGVPADSISAWGWRGRGTSIKLKDSISWLTGKGNNSTGFSARASGYRAWANGQFRALGEITYFWSATDDTPNNKPLVAWYRRIDGASQYIYKATTEKTGGKSVRCIKN
ncbi:MAG TPA: fibrobacter succinogenes major paralogous domain-containing protein [Bacteroidales bacterium]|nr:fibrobacter succinogenes major paralogous domain-containing protein [Bacteroidales bacterium]